MDSKIFKAKNKESGVLSATLLAATVNSATLTPVPAHAPGVIVLRPGTAFEEHIYYKTRDAGAGTISGLTRDYTNLNGGTGFDHTNGASWETLQASEYLNNIVDAILEGYQQEQATIAYVGATSFTVLGDVTAFYTEGRILRYNQDNTKIGIVASSSYNGGSGLTTVVTNYGTVPASLTHVEIGIMPKSATNLLALISGIQSSGYIYAADSGGSDAYAITLTPAITAYATGQVFLFKANTANTGAATLNVNGLGAKTIKKNKDQTLADGDIKAGALVLVQYDGTDLQMLSQIGNTMDTSGWNPYSAVVPTRTTLDDYVKKLTFAGVDLTGMISKGMRVKLAQTAGTNAQSLDLESGSSQYATRADTASLSITGTISIEAWVKHESTGVAQAYVSKFNQDGSVKSYVFYLDATGAIQLSYSGDSSNESLCASAVCISKADEGKWIHVAVTLTPSTKAFSFYKNGALITSGTATGAQTSIADNASGFAIGCRDIGGTPDTFLDGKICEVRLWNTVRTQAEIQGNMFHNLVGNESGLAGYWKLDNSYNDSTANANNLTGTGSPVFSADVPAKLTNGTKYGIVNDIAFSTDTTMVIDCGTDYGIDDGTISGFNYSPHKAPYGFPTNPTKWQFEWAMTDIQTQASPVANTWYNLGTPHLDLPLGVWKVTTKAQFATFAATSVLVVATLSTSTSSETDTDMTRSDEYNGASTGRPCLAYIVEKVIEATVRTKHYLLMKVATGGISNLYHRCDNERTILRATNAYL